eukprot:CAMPEP_0117438328 /NCGR_PEP_ID=MMETSP0759-20121206/1996_1 /TAXON_ID=63605 /ORGANISM="Percolomonas cosmopolitus, Strain WS" /LENGTH=695 /DNA_ID=CAMNT_0005230015 /DNA_START=615 /DNA_END=2702 /DNA_ORIENTATION=+
MVFEDLTDPYCQRSSLSGTFLEWKDTEAEQELSHILWRESGGELRDFSDEWQDDFLPRIVGRGLENPVSCLQGRSGSDSEDVAAGERSSSPFRSRQNTPSAAAPTMSHHSNVVESAITSNLDAAAAATETLRKYPRGEAPKEAWFGGYEEETFCVHGTFEELLWADSDVSHEEIAANTDQSSQSLGHPSELGSSATSSDNSPSKTLATLQDAVQKHKKYGFLPLEPESSIRMQVLCLLVDKAWESLYPVLIPLFPESRKRGSGRGRDSSGSGSSGKFTPGGQIIGTVEDSPRESEHSLNSSFNEDDFSTTASHSEIRLINSQAYQTDDLSERFSLNVDNQESAAARAQVAERSFVLMRPEGSGQDQNIAFGLDHAIRIRSYTAKGAGHPRSRDQRGEDHPITSTERFSRTRERGDVDSFVAAASDRRTKRLHSSLLNKSKFQSIYKNHEFFSTSTFSSSTSAGGSDKNQANSSTGSTTLLGSGVVIPPPPQTGASTSVPGSSKGRRPGTKRKKSRGNLPKKFGVTGTSATKSKRKLVSSGSKSRIPLPFSTLTTTNAHSGNISGGSTTTMTHPSFRPALSSRPVSVHGRAPVNDFGLLTGFPAARNPRQQSLHKLPRAKTRSTNLFKDRDRGLSLPTISSNKSSSNNSSYSQQHTGVIGAQMGGRRLMERAQTAISGHKRGAGIVSFHNPWENSR